MEAIILKGMGVDCENGQVVAVDDMSPMDMTTKCWIVDFAGVGFHGSSADGSS